MYPLLYSPFTYTLFFPSSHLPIFPSSLSSCLPVFPSRPSDALLVNEAQKKIQTTLVQNLYRERDFTDLLRETDDVSTRRQNCGEVLELLTKALEIVNEVRDFNCFQ
jgi:hypothetical protein